MTEKPSRKPAVRRGKPRGFQIPNDLDDWLDAYVEKRNKTGPNKGIWKPITRTDVVITALREYQKRETQSAKRAAKNEESP